MADNYEPSKPDEQPPEDSPSTNAIIDTQHIVDDALRDIDDRKWSIIPVKFGTKTPVEAGWTKKSLTRDRAKEIFNERPLNIGLLTGEVSGGTIDIDCDTDEASSIAHRLLPPTLCFGREGRPFSHRLYRSAGAGSATFVDPTDKRTLVEQRADKRHTIKPPSIHPSGEVIAWCGDVTEPVKIDATVLSKAVAKVAAATILARHWKQGSRHQLALACAGGLLRHGWSRQSVEEFIGAVAAAAGDDELEDRIRAVADAELSLAQDHPTTGLPTIIKLIGEPVVAVMTKWLGIGTKPTNPAGTGGTQAAIILQLIGDAELFHDAQGFPYARYRVGDHHETHPIKSHGRFAEHLLLRFTETQGAPPKRDGMESALAVFAARASRGPERSTALRLAMDHDDIAIDPGWDDWRVIKVRRDGYATADTSVSFIRPHNLGPLPIPVPGGSLDELRQFVNVASDRDFRLLVVFLLAALRPATSYPILVVSGEPGTAKTTSCRYVKLLCDPAKAGPLRSAPKTERDIAVATRSSHLPAFTNISHLTNHQSDTLCRIATGEGFGTRQLFTDDREVIFDGARPFLLNGIEDFVTRGDLQDRAIQIEFAPIPNDKRKTLDKLDAAFLEARPRIFGALLHALSAGVRNIDSTILKEHPRMADVVRWAVACSSGTPWSGEQLIADYLAMQADTAIVTVESDDVGHAIAAWARNNLVEALFIGTATELHRQLTLHTDESIHRRREWPSNGQQLVSALKRLAPALRKTGITYERHRSGKQGTRVITIKCVSPDGVPTPDGVGGTSTDPDPCSKCGKRMNLWWHAEQGIWICTCESHPRHPMSATWIKNTRPLPGEPIPSITTHDNSFTRLA